MTLKEWGSLVKLMKTIYQREEKFIPDAETAKAWFPLVEDMEYEKAKEAVGRYIKTERFAPTIADIRSLYDEIAAAEKHEEGEIRRFYDQARAYYPGSGEYGTGWKEFRERVKNAEEAERLQSRIIAYVNYIDQKTSEDVMPFVECIQTVKL